jgi:hypothetical protein
MNQVALEVECVADYIHLNPARAGVAGAVVASCRTTRGGAVDESVLDDMVGHLTPFRRAFDSGVVLTAYLPPAVLPFGMAAACHPRHRTAPRSDVLMAQPHGHHAAAASRATQRQDARKQLSQGSVGRLRRLNTFLNSDRE